MDVVFHFAANPEVRVSTTNPRIHYNENVPYAFNLLENMIERGVKELIFASLSSVCGKPDTIPASNDWIDVKTVVSTLLSELYIKDAAVECQLVLYGLGWPSDVKKIALDIRKLKELGFQPRLSSVETVRVSVKRLVRELNSEITQ